MERSCSLGSGIRPCAGSSAPDWVRARLRARPRAELLVAPEASALVIILGSSVGGGGSRSLEARCARRSEPGACHSSAPASVIRCASTCSASSNSSSNLTSARLAPDGSGRSRIRSKFPSAWCQPGLSAAGASGTAASRDHSSRLGVAGVGAAGDCVSFVAGSGSGSSAAWLDCFGTAFSPEPGAIATSTEPAASSSPPPEPISSWAALPWLASPRPAWSSIKISGKRRAPSLTSSSVGTSPRTLPWIASRALSASRAVSNMTRTATAAVPPANGSQTARDEGFGQRSANRWSQLLRGWALAASCLRAA